MQPDAAGRAGMSCLHCCHRQAAAGSSAAHPGNDLQCELLPWQDFAACPDHCCKGATAWQSSLALRSFQPIMSSI